jgi:hypothetical protein
MGDIIVAVNPYKRISGLYDMPSSDPTAPHLFQISGRAYNALWEDGQKNQMIIVNGESGAGKTESTKIMLRHLTWLSNELDEQQEVQQSRSYHPNEFAEFAHNAGFGSLDVESSDDEDQSDEEKNRSEDHIQAKVDAGTTSSAPAPAPKTKTKTTTMKQKVKVDDLVMNGNIVCEAFGNSKTIHNNNSSRFGKFLSLHYDSTTRTNVACSIHHFLLEQNRVVFHSKGERNFHSFYQMLAGANSKQRKDWRLQSNVDDYLYLVAKESVNSPGGGRGRKRKKKKKDGASETIQPKDDAADFAITIRSLLEVGFNYGEIDNIFQLLSGILMLGQLTFDTVSTVDDDTYAELRCAKQDEKNHIDLSCLLGLREENISVVLSKATTTRVMRTKRKSITEIKLTTTDAEASRDGLAKFLYSGIFDYVFDHLNMHGNNVTNIDNIDSNELKRRKTIGVLDIFGFEIVDKNSFEQLVINYANESLQSLYNEHVFQNELCAFEAEGIDVTNMTYTDNKKLLALFDKKPTGIFWLLDQQGMRGGEVASDVNFLSNINQSYPSGSNPFFARPRFGGNAFVVKHFAGDVNYYVDGFIKKNNDSLHDDLRFLFYNCSSPLIKEIMKAHKRTQISTGSGLTKSSSSGKLTGTMTVGKKIRNEMKSLSNIIHDASPHFVRCVKPNSTMSCSPNYDKPLVLQQLNHLGVLETCRIRRQGYPVRRVFKDIVDEYGCLSPLINMNLGRNEKIEPDLDMRSVCESILAQYATTSTTSTTNFDDDGDVYGDVYRIGTTKVFLRDGVLETLNKAKNSWIQNRRRAAELLQCTIRQRSAKQRVGVMLDIKRKHNASIKMTSLFRGRKARQRANRIKSNRKLRIQQEKKWDAAIKVIALMRGHLTRIRGEVAKLKEECSQKEAIVKVQALMRSKSLQRVYSQKQNSAVKIASFFRQKRSKAKFGKSRCSAILIQTVVRRRQGEKAYVKALRVAVENEMATHLQTWYRCRTARSSYYVLRLSVVSIQSCFRRYRTQYRYALYANIRRPWGHLLAKNECLLRVSYCVKYAGTGIAKLIGIKRRRLLFLTSAGRVIYADPRTTKAKGDFRLSLCDNFGVHLVDKSVFEFIAPTRKYKFMDMFVDSHGWAVMTKSFLVLLHEENPILVQAAAALESADGAGRGSTAGKSKGKKAEAKIPPLSMSTVLFSHTIDPLFAYLKQGLLLKLNLDVQKRKKKRRANKWDNRWFILHGTNLYWFKADAIGKPRGKVILNANSIVKNSADRDFCFKLITPLFPEGILLAAGSNNEKKMWLRALQRTIFQCKAKVDRKVRKHHREKSMTGDVSASLDEFRKSYVSVIEMEDDPTIGFDSGDEDEDNDKQQESSERKSHMRQQTKIFHLEKKSSLLAL